jgi:hypothetical protein
MPTYPSVEFSVQKQVDNIAAYKKALLAATVGRGSLWQMVDDAEDQVYENRVKGSSITAVDNSLNSTSFGNNIAQWFSLHNEYFSQDLGLGGLDGGLTAYRWRVSQFFNLVQYESGSSYLTPTNVFPRDDLVLGTHLQVGDAFTLGVALDPLQSGPGKVAAIADNVIGAAAYNLSATVTRLDGSFTQLTASFPAASPAGTSKTFGEQALSGNCAAGQPTLLVAATTQFIVGDYVLIGDSQNTEWGIILSMVPNTSITLTASVRNSYTLANNAKVTPLYAGVTAATSGGSGSAGDGVTFRFNPDRALNLGYVHVPA